MIMQKRRGVSPLKVLIKRTISGRDSPRADEYKEEGQRGYRAAISRPRWILIPFHLSEIVTRWFDATPIKPLYLNIIRIGNSRELQACRSRLNRSHRWPFTHPHHSPSLSSAYTHCPIEGFFFIYAHAWDWNLIFQMLRFFKRNSKSSRLFFT